MTPSRETELLEALKAASDLLDMLECAGYYIDWKDEVRQQIADAIATGEPQ